MALTLHLLQHAPKITCVAFLLLIGCSVDVKSMAFDSIASLKTLIDRDDWLVDKVQEYLVREEERLQQVREQLKRVTSWSAQKKTLGESWEAYVTELVEHPINALNLIKDWGDLTRLAKQTSTFDDVFQNAEASGVNLPEEIDYKGALVALIRLQKTYNIPTTDMARGVIQNSTALNGMSPHDFFEMGKLAMDVEHGMALSWLELFLEEGSPEPQEETVALGLVMDIYERAADFERAWITGNKMRMTDPNNPVLYERMEGFLRNIELQKKRGNLAQQKYFWKNARDRGLEHYEALCRGEHLNNDILKNKDLMCVYRSGKIPYLQYKEEIHSFSPRISLFIDVISDKQAEMLKQLAYPGLFRAQVGDPSQKIISEERVGKLNWLWDTDPRVGEISQKVSDITGLSTTYHEEHSHAEAFQIVNYGMGGQYEPHYDYYEQTDMLSKLPSFLMGTGDRISTFMFYLSDVTAGGATVFPTVRVRVPPIKNAAAYWYNFDLAGEIGDTRTLHAGCPVLLGQKWVGNKWIRQEGQHFKRPCSLYKYAVDPIWYS